VADRKQVRELERQLKKEPHNLGLRLILAAAYRDDNRVADAVALYRAVAEAYRADGRIQQAIDVMRSAIDASPLDVELVRMRSALEASTTATPSASGSPARPEVGTDEHLGPRPRGARVGEPVPVRELEPMLARPTRPSERPTPSSTTSSRSTPSGATPYTPTPLPGPMPYHEADPSRVNALAFVDERSEVTDDTEPTKPGATVRSDVGLSSAARRISQQMTVPEPSTDDETVDTMDLASDLETRRRPRVEAGDLDRLAQPPTVQMPKLEPASVDDDVEIEVDDGEPAPLGALGDYPDEITDPRGDFVHEPSNVFDRPLGDALRALAPDGSPLAPGVAGLPDAARARLIAAGTRRVVPRGGVLVKDNDVGTSVFVIVSGDVRVLRERDGNRVEIARLGSGSIVGEIAAHTDGRRHATVEAITDVTVVEVAQSNIAAIAAEHPELAELLDRLVRERVLSNLVLQTAFLAPLGADHRARVLARFRPRKVSAGTAVIEQGKPAPGLFLVVLGALEVSVRRPDGRDVVLELLTEGAYAGELSLMNTGPAVVTVTAICTTELAALPPRDFFQIVGDHPAVWSALKMEAARRTAQLEAALR
jgi:CRP-like cAMP-binding protein